MGAVVVLGEPALVAGYALAGVKVIPAPEPADVRRAWADLPSDITLVILTEAAARALPDKPVGPLVAVMPQ